MSMIHIVTEWQMYDSLHDHMIVKLSPRVRTDNRVHAEMERNDEWDQTISDD